MIGIINSNDSSTNPFIFLTYTQLNLKGIFECLKFPSKRALLAMSPGKGKNQSLSRNFWPVKAAYELAKIHFVGHDDNWTDRKLRPSLRIRIHG